MKYKIRYKQLDRTNDYGTNYYANKALNEHYNIRPNEIFIDPDVKGRMRKRTIVHEKIEAYLMHKKHLTYPKAHKIAMKWEKNVNGGYAK